MRDLSQPRHLKRGPLTDEMLAEALAVLSEDLRYTLEQASIQGDPDAVEQLIALILPEHAALADALTALTVERG